MSEPSPVAKQAAEWEFGNRVDRHGLPIEESQADKPAGYYVQRAIDTATAKAQEELEQLKREQQVLFDIHAALGIKWGQDPYAVINELKQLAHQQPRRWPSEVPLFGKPAPVKQQPSAPTAEDQRVPCKHCGCIATAREWDELKNECLDLIVQRNELRAASAPTADETKSAIYKEMAPKGVDCSAKGQVEFKQVKGVDLRPTYEELEAVALASTGKNESLAGKTGNNNKQKRRVSANAR